MDQRAFNFPEVRIENRYQDDELKLHSDLVGVDFSSLTGAPGEISQADEEALAREEAEFLQYSLPIFDPRKQSKMTKPKEVSKCWA